MRFSDMGLLAVVLGLGILVGAIGTVAVYHRIADQQAEAQESEAREALTQIQQERDQLQARINDYQEAERRQREALEQPNGDEPPARPAAPTSPVVAAAPRPNTTAAKERELVPGPHEEGTTPTTPPARLGPPVPPRPLDDHATDAKQKTTP